MKKRVTRILFLFFWPALAAGCVFVQTGRSETLPVKSYTTSDGLAHDRVNRIVRDSRGFLWFCTSEGLSRFDGYEFKNYTQDDGLPHRAVKDFLETRSGTFWIATNDGLVLFDPAGNSARNQGPVNESQAPMFRTFHPGNLKSGPATLEIDDLMEDRDGQVWAATSKGVFRMGDDRQMTLFDIPAARETGFEEFLNILEDKNGSIWAGSLSGLYRILPDRSAVQTATSGWLA